MARTTAIAIVGLILGLPAGPVSGAPVNLAGNPSFESGGGAPTEWSVAAGGRRTAGGRSGGFSLAASSARAHRAATSDPIPVDPAQSYRLGGWLRVASGKARLGMDVLDSRGQALATTSTPWAATGAAWIYAAVERDMPAGAATLGLWFEAQGRAALDDVVLAPMVANMVYNPTFDTDARQRVGMWGDETSELLAGARGGSQRGDPAGGRSGAALLLEPAPARWCGARVVPATLPAGLGEFQLHGWVRRESGIAVIGLLWLDPDERVVSADMATSTGPAGEWERVSVRARAPAGAVQVAVAAAAEGGKARLDDFSLMPVAPARSRKPVVQVFVNQVGYEPAGSKSAVAASNFFPTQRPEGVVEVLGEGGRVAARVPIRAARIHEGDTADWGSYYWRADFSSLRAPGRYRARARIGDIQGESFPFEIGRRVLVGATGRLGVDFFFVQRCGFEVPGWHAACHLDDARLPDGRHIEATGGWHSAGDYNKLMYENGDGGVAFALLRAYSAFPDPFQKDDRDRDGRPDIVDEALWGARFVARMQNPATGGFYFHLQQGPERTWMKWSPPEVHTDNRVGTADDPVIQAGEGSSPFVPAAWMRLARILGDSAEAADYRDRARRAWAYETAKPGAENSPPLLIAALDLHATTGEPGYLEFARRSAQSILSQQVRSGRLRGAWGTSGELAAGSLASFALARPTDPLAEPIRAALQDTTGFLVSTADNPFGLSKQSVGEKEYFFEPTSTMGVNFAHLQKAWAALLIHRLTGDPRARRFADDQIDWVLGKNPYNLCQMEGAGRLNPPRYHHRYDSIPGHERGAVPGCIPNGFVRTVAGEDQPGFDMSRPGPGKRHASYRTSEPWLVHNMWYLLVLDAVG